MKYTANEVAERLQLNKNTLRAYSLKLEQAGYVIARDNAKNRTYNAKDVAIITDFITLCRDKGMTQDEAASRVSSADYVTMPVNSNDANVIEDNAGRSNVPDRYASDIKDLHDVIELLTTHIVTVEQQNAELLTQYQTHSNDLEVRDKLIIAMQSELSQQMAEQAATIEELRKQLDKPAPSSLWVRLFGGKK